MRRDMRTFKDCVTYPHLNVLIVSHIAIAACVAHVLGE